MLSFLGEFILTHEAVRCPVNGSIYSINEGNASQWDATTTAYVAQCKAKGKSARYVGSMVADVHRTLLYGGVFMYPGTTKAPDGKLRLLYECAPMAFLMEKAGGAASTGSERILDLLPKTIHERRPIFLGSKTDVDAIDALYAKLAKK